MRADYCGSVDDSCYRFDAELVEKVVAKLKHGKAAGLVGQHSKPIVQFVIQAPNLAQM